MLLILISILSRLINIEQFDSEYMNKCILSRIAAIRPVTLDSTCVAASKHHAKYLATTQTIGHIESASYKGALRTIDERKVDGEICLTYLAYSSYYKLTYEELADKMIANWLASGEHKAVMINPKLVKAGVSVVYNSKDDTYYAVVNFRYN